MLGVVTLHSPSCNAPGCEEREEVSSSLLMSSMPSSEADTSVQTFLACTPLAERQNFRFCFVIAQSYFVFAQKTSYLPYLGLDVLHTGLRLSLCLRSLRKFSFLEKNNEVVFSKENI